MGIAVNTLHTVFGMAFIQCLDILNGVVMYMYSHCMWLQWICNEIVRPFCIDYEYNLIFVSLSFVVEVVPNKKKSLNPFFNMMMMSLLFCQCTVYPFILSRFYYDLFCLHSGAPLQRTHFYMLLKTLYLMNVIAVMISTLSF